MALSRINTNSIQDGTVIAADILDGTISSSKLVSANIAGDRIAANTLSNTVFQTGSVENYLRGANLDFGMRNRIINGAMRIDQRNAGAAVTPSSGAQTFTLDRWSFYPTQAAKLTTQQNQGSVTPPPGFTNYIGVTSSSSYSVVSSDFFILYQWIEGFNTADLDFGKSTAKTVTLSFWVRSSLTGTFGGSLINSAQNRCYPFTYSISSANTWTQISIRIPGDTTGTWIGATNGQGMAVIFSLGAGSTYSGTANAWSATSQLYSATGAVSVVGTNAATWYVTGVQLEEGSVPTAFEYRQYTTELQLCQRYFNSMGGNHDYEHFATVSQTSSTDARGMVFLPVSMRTIPTIGQSGSFSVNGGTSSITGTFSAGTTMYFNIAGNFGGVQNLGFDFWTGTAGNYNQNAASMWIVRANASQATRLTFSAEL